MSFGVTKLIFCLPKFRIAIPIYVMNFEMIVLEVKLAVDRTMLGFSVRPTYKNLYRDIQ